MQPAEQAADDLARAVGVEGPEVDLGVEALQQEHPVAGQGGDQAHRAVAGPGAQGERLTVGVDAAPDHLQGQRLAVAQDRRDDGGPAGAQRTVGDQPPSLERLTEQALRPPCPLGAARAALGGQP